MINLHNCPHCAAEPRIIEHPPRAASVSIRCKGCQRETPAMGDSDQNRDALTERWNAATPPPAAEVKSAAVREAVKKSTAEIFHPSRGCGDPVFVPHLGYRYCEPSHLCPACSGDGEGE